MDWSPPEPRVQTFHRVPYATAQRQGEIQADILDQLCRSITVIEAVDWKLADRLISQHLGGV